MTNPTASIIIIGNEILSGRTQDANVQFICKQLSNVGVVVKEVRVIPDEEDTIITTVRELSKKYTTVITTGGIGATHDDITAASIAKAFNRELIEDPRALALVKDYYKERINEARLRLAKLPANSLLIDNPISMAPGFQVENVFCIAGIPLVMQAMLGNVLKKIETGTPINQKTITCALPENVIADDLAIIQQKHSGVEIGSYPFYHANGSFGVSLVVRGTNEEHLTIVIKEIAELVSGHGATPTFD